MCRAVACKKCGKTTWAGCGMHVDQVMRDVAPENRCPGHENDPDAKSGGFLQRLLGRS